MRTLFKTGKLEELKCEMRRNKINMLGQCETRWRGQDGVMVILIVIRSELFIVVEIRVVEMKLQLC